MTTENNAFSNEWVIQTMGKVGSVPPVSKKDTDLIHAVMEEYLSKTTPEQRDQLAYWHEDHAKSILSAVDVRSIIKHPLVVRRMREGIDAIIKQAWQAEAERLLYTAYLASPHVIFGLRTQSQAKNYFTDRLQAYLLLKQSVPFLWREEIHMKARDLPLPRHTIPESLLPYTQMYWTFEGAHDIQLREQEQVTQNGLTGLEADGMLLQYTPPNNIQVFSFGMYEITENETSKHGIHMLPMCTITTGSTWPDDYDADSNEQAAVGYVLKMLSFLNSPYVLSNPERLGRQTLKELKRAKVEQLVPPIHVVKLRQAPIRSNANGNPEREYKHQWWVRGHIRAQWYPSLKGHKLVWIREHLKGPSDAPIIQKVYDVQR